MKDNPGAQQRLFLAGFLTLLLVGFIGCGGFFWWHNHRGWTVPRITHLIQSEVQLGWDRTTSEAWFDQHGIHHDWFNHTDLGYRRGAYTMPQLAGLDASKLSGMMVGRIEGPDAYVDVSCPGYFHVFFFFDKQGRLVGHVVDPSCYSF